MQDYENAIEAEFNFEYPANYRHGQHGLLKENLLKHVKNRCNNVVTG